MKTKIYLGIVILFWGCGLKLKKISKPKKSNVEMIVSGERAEKKELKVHLNQLGFPQVGNKGGVVVASSENIFEIRNQKNEVVYKNILEPEKLWSPSLEKVKYANFSEFKKEGLFSIYIAGKKVSPDFEISNLNEIFTIIDELNGR